MSNKQLSTVATVLIKARNLLSDIDNWCPEVEGVNGERRLPNGRVQRCAIRAVSYMSEGLDDDPYLEYHDRVSAKAIHALSQAAFPNSVINVNAQGHAAVMALYDKAITKAIANVL